MATGSISIRRSIRWLPDEPTEPTSTIVLTSPQRRFVDVRILHDGSLDWAIAGTSSTSQDGRRAQWKHWIDSRTTQPEEAVDQADMYPQPDGSTLEKGTMVNPETGRATPYEEVWDDEEVQGTCVVLRLEDADGGRGLATRLGRSCQGFVRKRDSITVERWEAGRRVVRIGDEELPCEKVVQGAVDGFREGQRVGAGARIWTVVEVSKVVDEGG